MTFLLSCMWSDRYRLQPDDTTVLSARTSDRCAFACCAERKDVNKNVRERCLRVILIFFIFVRSLTNALKTTRLLVRSIGVLFYFTCAVLFEMFSFIGVMSIKGVVINSLMHSVMTLL